MPTPSYYTFTKQIDIPSELAAAISLAGIPFVTMDTSGSGESMLVTVWTSDILTSEQETTLSGVVSGWTNLSCSPSTYAAIASALEDDANIILLLRAKINTDLTKMPLTTIRSICSLLGITMS